MFFHWIQRLKSLKDSRSCVSTVNSARSSVVMKTASNVTSCQKAINAKWCSAPMIRRTCWRSPPSSRPIFWAVSCAFCASVTMGNASKRTRFIRSILPIRTTRIWTQPDGIHCPALSSGSVKRAIARLTLSRRKIVSIWLEPEYRAAGNKIFGTLEVIYIISMTDSD